MIVHTTHRLNRAQLHYWAQKQGYTSRKAPLAVVVKRSPWVAVSLRSSRRGVIVEPTIASMRCLLVFLVTCGALWLLIGGRSRLLADEVADDLDRSFG